MRSFLIALTESGTVEVPPASERPADDADDVLRDIDAVRRKDAPHEAPAFDLDTARWGARLLFRACQFLADREIDGAAVDHELRSSAPVGEAAARIWSADLSLCQLPELESLARGIAPADPLVLALRHLGSEWPLSSVGMTISPPSLPDAIVEHPCLRQIYVDRILHRGDRARLDAPWLVDAARAALGDHAELAPEIGAALADRDADDG